MPARRKSHRREASSDIEDGQSSQVVARDDVDEDGEDQLQPPTRTVASSKKGRGRAAAEEEAPAPNENINVERIDVTNFQDQPLRKEDVLKISGLARDWQLVADTISKAGPVFGSVGVSLADASNDETTKKSLISLENLLKGFIDTQAEMRLHAEVLEDIGQEVAQSTQIDNAIERYENGVSEKKEGYSKKTSRQKYAKDETYKSFKADLYEVDHPGAAMPPVTDFIPQEAGDDSDDDDDLEIGGITQDYKCPLTLMPLKNPVTSEICGHSFSHDAIKEMFRNSRGAKKCPAAGCNKAFNITNCKPNPALEKKIKLYERRQKRKEEAQDAEEVVE
ncbi:hypothetical protein K435DRAFT_745498 [Dendrothele bispora CBS 962.96]|uniref:SP-RING-type domain-containing protein n=1 Tax=Dendrothele bispora (strain CBS 962.96) TaxID=1314807 RepID=A0A4S8MQC1_DENBC|nr:hypothetical protein K435DRAFT_745498 [Dendrothele bispora CBS 962.96]